MLISVIFSELATNATILATENWGLNMEICDFVNSTEDGAKDAVRAIRRRLHTNMCKNNAIVMYTLTVLETCVKNCGHNFHVLVCSKDFVQDLVKLIGSKFDTPQIIHERILSLIQVVADIGIRYWCVIERFVCLEDVITLTPIRLSSNWGTCESGLAFATN
uniref:VHS domain-containing protein n=1 Tax=Angiostrongylus cantonensis TaxID=6313 RepID=A0A0K0D700_ANGCA